MEWQNFSFSFENTRLEERNSHFPLESLNRILLGHLIELQQLHQTLHNKSMIQTQKHVGMYPFMILYSRVVWIVIWGKVCSNARLYFLSARPLLRYEYREAEVATPKLLKTHHSQKIFVLLKSVSLKIQHIYTVANIFANTSKCNQYFVIASCSSGTVRNCIRDTFTTAIQ